MTCRDILGIALAVALGVCAVAGFGWLGVLALAIVYWIAGSVSRVRQRRQAIKRAVDEIQEEMREAERTRERLRRMAEEARRKREEAAARVASEGWIAWPKTLDVQ